MKLKLLEMSGFYTANESRILRQGSDYQSDSGYCTTNTEETPLCKKCPYAVRELGRVWNSDLGRYQEPAPMFRCNSDYKSHPRWVIGEKDYELMNQILIHNQKEENIQNQKPNGLEHIRVSVKIEASSYVFCQLGYYSRNDCPEDLDKIEIRIWSCSYTELRGLYHSGLLEKSDELQEFRKWIEDLPYCEWIMTPYWT